jgi:uncharacterized membrane protein
MKSYHSKDVIHAGFEIGLLFKGIDGLLEIIGGVFLIFLSPQRLNHLLFLFTKSELSEDPRDMISNFLINFGHSFSINTQLFSIIYLLSHGIVKLILIFLLRKKLLWAYPFSAAFLVLFIIYQMYRYSFTQSPFLILLTILDLFMILLTWLEYKRLRLSQS